MSPLPDQDNPSTLPPEEERHLKRTLNASRFRLGVANLFFNGEESSLGGIKVFILKSLGGNDAHFGISSSFGALVALLQSLAIPTLNYFRSNRKAMRFALSLGVLCGFILALAGLGTGAPDSLKPVVLYLFLVTSLLMSAATGIQSSVETNWIGDLVPKPMRGWFVSVKSVVSIAGMVALSLLFGFIVDYNNSLPRTSCGLYLVVALSHLLAIAIMGRIPDATPKPARLFGQGDGAKVNFRSPVFWGVCAFAVFWATGRSVFGVFYSVFLLQEFGFGLLQLNSLNVVTWGLSMATLMVAGRLADRKGNRRPLMFISTAVGCAMLLVLLTPWFGLKVILLYTVINSMAGSTHSMLITNYMLETFPAAGRAAYVSVVRITIGISGLVGSLTVGAIGRALEVRNWTLHLGGVTYSRYHLIFTAGALIAASSSAWLLLIGNRIVHPIEAARPLDAFPQNS